MNQIEIVIGNQARLGKVVEVHQPLPEVCSKQNNGHAAFGANLPEGEQLKQFIERAKAAREEDGANRAHHKMEFAQ